MPTSPKEFKIISNQTELNSFANNYVVHDWHGISFDGDRIGCKFRIQRAIFFANDCLHALND